MTVDWTESGYGECDAGEGGGKRSRGDGERQRVQEGGVAFREEGLRVACWSQ